MEATVGVFEECRLQGDPMGSCYSLRWGSPHSQGNSTLLGESAPGDVSLIRAKLLRLPGRCRQ